MNANRLRCLSTFLPVVILAACSGWPLTASTNIDEATATAFPAATIGASAAPEHADSSIPSALGRLRLVSIGPMLEERAAHQATLLRSGAVLITGGCAGRGCDTVLDAVEVFDPASGTFRSAAPMHSPRVSHVAARLADGRVLVAGGWTDRGVTASAEIYDPALDRWTTVPDMNAARGSHVAVPLGDGRVLIVGGGEGGLGDLNSAEVFQPDTGQFVPVAPMHANHYLATALADGRVLVTGGQTAAGAISPSAEIFDPATGGFEPTGTMQMARVKHAAARLQDGRIVVLGGSGEAGYAGRLSSTEIYDPSSGVFSPGPDLTWGRHKLRDAVAALASGAILVAGGAAQPELLDAAGRAFQPVPGDLGGAAMFATATRLEDGDVLVLGGYDEHTQPSDAAWLVSASRSLDDR
jgi:Kelch motif